MQIQYSPAWRTRNVFISSWGAPANSRHRKRKSEFLRSFKFQARGKSHPTEALRKRHTHTLTNTQKKKNSALSLKRFHCWVLEFSTSHIRMEATLKYAHLGCLKGRRRKTARKLQSFSLQVHFLRPLLWRELWKYVFGSSRHLPSWWPAHCKTTSSLISIVRPAIPTLPRHTLNVGTN